MGVCFKMGDVEAGFGFVRVPGCLLGPHLICSLAFNTSLPEFLNLSHLGLDHLGGLPNKFGGWFLPTHSFGTRILFSPFAPIEAHGPMQTRPRSMACMGVVFTWRKPKRFYVWLRNSQV